MLTRRGFLRTSCLGLCGAGIGVPARRLLGEAGPQGVEAPDIDPGFIGPQFFDEREEQALLDVVESGSPFRYWGPGTPTKVLRFEENFAKHMGALVALPGNLGIKDDLGDSLPVAQIDEDQVPQVSSAVHPPHEDDLPADLLRPQAPTIMGPLPGTQGINPYGFLFFHDGLVRFGVGLRGAQHRRGVEKVTVPLPGSC